MLLLKEPNPDSPANSKAANMFMKDYEQFKKTVRLYSENSWVHN